MGGGPVDGTSARRWTSWFAEAERSSSNLARLAHEFQTLVGSFRV